MQMLFPSYPECSEPLFSTTSVQRISARPGSPPQNSIQSSDLIEELTDSRKRGREEGWDEAFDAIMEDYKKDEPRFSYTQLMEFEQEKIDVGFCHPKAREMRYIVKGIPFLKFKTTIAQYHESKAISPILCPPPPSPFFSSYPKVEPIEPLMESLSFETEIDTLLGHQPALWHDKSQISLKAIFTFFECWDVDCEKPEEIKNALEHLLNRETEKPVDFRFPLYLLHLYSYLSDRTLSSTQLEETLELESKHF